MRIRPRLSIAALCFLIALLVTYMSPALSAQELEGLVARVAAESPEEAFSVARGDLDRMAQVKVGDLVALSDFPTEVGKRRPVQLERVDIYAKDAKIWLAEVGGRRELPRSDRLFFRGYATDGSDVRIAVSMDRETQRFTGTVLSPEGASEILEQSAGDPNLQAVRKVGRRTLEYRCGADIFDAPAELRRSFAGVEPESAGLVTTRGAAGLREAVIAIDTDHEFHRKRFSNNTTTATNWIADVFNAMNTLYERDLDLHLTQGDTTFRLDTGPADPWTVSGTPNANGAQLFEFGNWWAANKGNVDRTLAALFSGKQSQDNYASGIAWLDGYCEKQCDPFPSPSCPEASWGSGYSINQIFTAKWATIDQNISIIAHELGHNFGSPHTHCYNPRVDTCYNGEAANGCWGGSESCPGGGSGTLMSYCHLSGAGCGPNELELHSTVANLMDGLVDAHYPACVGDYDPNGIFSDGFESGSTSNWS